MRKVLFVAVGLLFSVDSVFGMEAAQEVSKERICADACIGALEREHKAAFNFLCEMIRKPSSQYFAKKRFKALVDRGIIYEDQNHRWHIVSTYVEALARKNIWKLCRDHRKAFESLCEMRDDSTREFSSTKRFKALVDQGMIYEDQDRNWHIARPYIGALSTIVDYQKIFNLAHQDEKTFAYMCEMACDANIPRSEREFNILVSLGIICEDTDHHWSVVKKYMEVISNVKYRLAEIKEDERRAAEQDEYESEEAEKKEKKKQEDEEERLCEQREWEQWNQDTNGGCYD